MSRARGWLARLINMFRPGRGERDVDAELQAHLELAVEDNVRLGMTPTEARRVALARLGGVESIREQCRDVRRVIALDELGRDLRFGARMLAKSRGFTAVAVLSLALGIGVNTAVFSVVDAMLFRPFPYDEPDRLVWIGEMDLREPGGARSGLRVAEYQSLRQRADAFAEVAFHQDGGGITAGGTQGTVASEVHPPERLWGMWVSANLFTMLGVQPLLGRGFVPEDGQPVSENVVIVSHRLWQHRFGGGAPVIGETLWLDGTATTIVGVMPTGLSHLTQYADFWVPARPAQLDGENWIQVIARLAPGVTLAQAQVTIDTLAAQRAFREIDDGWSVRMEPVHEAFTRDFRQSLFVLWGAVVFVLLIACANVAAVLLTRASARTKEVATRLALGASRGRVVRMFLAEGVLLALAGGSLGSLLALGGVRLIRVFNPDSNPLTFEMFPRLSAASVDGRVFGYTLLISLLTALLFSIAPALTGSRLDLTKSLKDAGRGATAGASRLRLRSALVVGQVALALVLLTGAGLMVGTLRNLTAVDPGFDVGQVLTFRVALNRDRSVRDAAHAGEPEPELSPRVDTFHARVLRRLQTLPGVESAAGITFLPLSSSGVSRIVAIAGHPAPAPGDEFRDWRRKGWIRPLYRAVMGDYFDVMGIPLLRGRAFTVRDGVEAPWVVVINRAMAETYWPNEDPVGQPLRVVRDWFGGPAPGERQRTVVGVVEDVHERSLQEGPRPAIYVHAVQQPLS